MLSSPAMLDGFDIHEVDILQLQLILARFSFAYLQSPSLRSIKVHIRSELSLEHTCLAIGCGKSSNRDEHCYY